MKKWLIPLVLVVLVGASWVFFARAGAEINVKTEEVRKLQEQGDADGKGAKLQMEIDGISNERIFEGVLLAFLSAGLVGVFFVVQILPSIAHRFTHAIYDSAEMLDTDSMHDARSLLAQGDYHGAIAAFREAAAADPMNRLLWLEITKIYKDKLGDSAGAVQTIRHALESQEWEINDAAYLLFRLAELYDELEGDRASARAIMQQVVDQFPGTRHSANASHKLHDWDLADSEVLSGQETPA